MVASTNGEMKPIRMEWKICLQRDRRLAKFLKKIQFSCFGFLSKSDGLLSLKSHSTFIRQHIIPPTFCSTMIVRVRWPWMALIRPNCCHNLVVQLIILCIFMHISLVPYTVLLFCLKAMGQSQWVKWLWSAPNISCWAIAAGTNRKSLCITPQASSE